MLMRILACIVIFTLFPFKIFANQKIHHDLFERLGISEEFLASPLCLPRRSGTAMVTDFAVHPKDPLVKSGKVKRLNKKGLRQGDHGNVVAGFLSHLIPAGRTLLQATKSIFKLGKDLTLRAPDMQPILVHSYSIDYLVSGIYSLSDKLDRAYKDVSRSLRKYPDKIIVLAAGNEQLFSSKDFCFFTQLINRFTPEEKKRLVVVGSTVSVNGEELIESRYTNLAGEFHSNFIYGPSRLMGFSPEKDKDIIHHGTSYAAPVIAGLLTRALLANPKITSKEAVQLLFRTGNKRKFISTGNDDFDRQLYGHGMVDATTFFKSAHLLNNMREKGIRGPIDIESLIEGAKTNNFKDYNGNLKAKLQLLAFLHTYLHLSDSFTTEVKKIGLEVNLDALLRENEEFEPDDFVGCVILFLLHQRSESEFTDFALSRFSFADCNSSGESLLTQAIKLEKNDLVQRLLDCGFDINLRGRNIDGPLGPLPLHLAAYRGDASLVEKLIAMKADINETYKQFDDDSTPNNSFILTLSGGDYLPRVNERIKILDLLYENRSNYFDNVDDELAVAYVKKQRKSCSIV